MFKFRETEKKTKRSVVSRTGEDHDALTRNPCVSGNRTNPSRLEPKQRTEQRGSCVKTTRTIIAVLEKGDGVPRPRPQGRAIDGHALWKKSAHDFTAPRGAPPTLPIHCKPNAPRANLAKKTRDTGFAHGQAARLSYILVRAHVKHYQDSRISSPVPHHRACTRYLRRRASP